MNYVKLKTILMDAWPQWKQFPLEKYIYRKKYIRYTGKVLSYYKTTILRNWELYLASWI